MSTKVWNFDEFLFEAKSARDKKNEKAMHMSKKTTKKPVKKSSKKDQDGDGDSDFADAKVAQYLAGGIDKKKAIKMSKKFNK